MLVLLSLLLEGSVLPSDKGALLSLGPITKKQEGREVRFLEDGLSK